MAQLPLEGVQLDHVAHAVPRWQDVWGRYAADLGAVWHSGGPGPGFAPAQLRFANQARLEVLMPWDTSVNDFLARFLATSGPGPHHLTFKVPDLEAALDAARTAGFTPIGVDKRFPEWMEAFLHPKVASGVVVQLAQSMEGLPLGDPPSDYPADERRRPDGSGPVPPAALRRVVHAQADLSVGRQVFCDLLGGRITAKWRADGLCWVDLTWGGPLGLRLVGPDTDPGGGDTGAGRQVLRSWVGDRQGRIHHLEFDVDDPPDVPGAVAVDRDAPWWGDAGPATGAAWVDPAVNAGLGLALLPRTGDGRGGK